MPHTTEETLEDCIHHCSPVWRTRSAAKSARQRFTKLANDGLHYNAFHTTAICSPTRAAILTGRNHTRVGSGTIAERAVAFDGYTGVMPKTAATVAEVLKHHGYHTSAFGQADNLDRTCRTSSKN